MSMLTPNRSFKSACYRAAIILCLVLVGCSATTPINGEKLDPLTGVTVTYVGTPLVLYRENAATAAFARNYVNLGPIQVNRSGSYRYYLWLGIWNTMQRPDLSGHRDGFESIVIFADGEPLALESAGWTPGAIGISEPVYLKPVASAADAYYQVTADQIRLIAEASDIRLQSSGPRAKEFSLWDAQTSAKESLAKFMLAALL